MTLTTKWQNYISNTIKKYTKKCDPNPPTLLEYSRQIFKQREIEENEFMKRRIYSILDCKTIKKEKFDWKKEGF